MLDHLLLRLEHYWYSLSNLLLREWQRLDPLEYGFLLVGIALVGWLMMRHGPS